MSSSSDSSDTYFLALFLRLAGVFFDDEDEFSFDDDATAADCFRFLSLTFMLSESDELELSSSGIGENYQ